MKDAKTLLASLPEELINALLSSYTEIESNFVHRKWKVSELDAGHFVEAARRIVEHKLIGNYTAIGKDLPKFTDQVLVQYEQRSGDETYRILIPRVLRAIYGVRNKRGVGHLGKVSPNEMDATLILYNVKWVLAEIMRLESGLTPEETQRAVDRVVERQIALLWKDGDIVRVIDESMETRDQVLLHLNDSSPQTETDLREKCEYKNPTNFRKILKGLHQKKLIFYGPDSKCLITPLGVKAAEKLALSRL